MSNVWGFWTVSSCCRKNIEQLKKWVAQLPVCVKGEVNGMPPLTHTDICAVWMARRLSPDFIYKVC